MREATREPGLLAENWLCCCTSELLLGAQHRASLQSRFLSAHCLLYFSPFCPPCCHAHMPLLGVEASVVSAACFPTGPECLLAAPCSSASLLLGLCCPCLALKLEGGGGGVSFS